jgi:hypothetical protein
MNSTSKNLLEHYEKQAEEILLAAIHYYNKGFNLEADILYSTYLAHSLN